MRRGTIFLTCNVSSFICPLIKNTHTNPTNYFGFSQIFSKLLPKLGSHKYLPYYYQNLAHTNISHIITNIELQNYTISMKAHIHLSCRQNPKGTANLLQSLLLHNTYYKAQEKYLAIFVKAQVRTWQYFTKSQNIIKSPNTTFGNILSKTQILFWQHFTKNSLLL